MHWFTLTITTYIHAHTHSQTHPHFYDEDVTYNKVRNIRIAEIIDISKLKYVNLKQKYLHVFIIL